jgi:type I restriction enzyme S subunit
MSGSKKATRVAGARTFRPYPAYKDSGAKWLGQIPAHWDSTRLKRLFSVVSGSTPQSAVPEYWDGDIPWVTPEDLGELDATELHDTRRNITRAGYQSCGTSLVPAGTLVLLTRAPIGHLAMAGLTLCTNQGCRSLVFRRDSVKRFFFYQILAARPELVSLGRGSTFKELAKDKLEEIVIGEPPLDEQRAIAAFLDRESAKIDAMVAKKERLIELLLERRTALITRAITEGIDPNVPVKDSGLEVLGTIPAHWEVRRLRDLSPRLGVGVVVNPTSYVTDEGLPFLYGSDIGEGRIDADRARRIAPENSRRLSQSQLHTGDLVMVRVGAPGVTAVVSPELEGANCASVLVIRRSSRFESDWLCYALNSRLVRSQVEIVQYGAAQEQFNVSHAVNFVVGVPPLPEQRRIAAFVDQQTTSIDALVAKIRDAVDCLSEFRTALIFAAVTGRIDVRQEVA